MKETNYEKILHDGCELRNMLVGPLIKTVMLSSGLRYAIFPAANIISSKINDYLNTNKTCTRACQMAPTLGGLMGQFCKEKLKEEKELRSNLTLFASDGIPGFAQLGKAPALRADVLADVRVQNLNLDDSPGGVLRTNSKFKRIAIAIKLFFSRLISVAEIVAIPFFTILNQISMLDKFVMKKYGT